MSGAAGAAGVAALLADLDAEGADLDRLVAPLDAAGWRTPTPAAGWTVAHQVAHLAWTDELSTTALTDPAGFAAALPADPAAVAAAVDEGAARGARAAPGELLVRWRRFRAALRDALAAADPSTPVGWIGTAMKPASMATARIMETWAHGQDVADALGARRAPSARLRHVAHLGVRTLGHAFRTRGRPAPDAPVRVELTGPDGERWTWGPADAADRVTGPAEDFALLVTRRGHPDGLALRAEGPVATAWLPIAQAFAGPPGPQRPPSA